MPQGGPTRWPPNGPQGETSDLASRYGEGPIYKDKAKGLWVGSVELGVIDGTRRRKRVKASTKEVLIAKMREVQGAVAKGLPVTEATATTGEWLSWWASELLRDNWQVRATTIV